MPHTGQFCSSAGGETKIPKLNKTFPPCITVYTVVHDPFQNEIACRYLSKDYNVETVASRNDQRSRVDEVYLIRTPARLDKD